LHLFQLLLQGNDPGPQARQLGKPSPGFCLSLLKQQAEQQDIHQYNIWQQ
jgi:hypothetical protein